ncbi:MAG: hypothetical protein ACRDRV_14470 [Pseudonocardiaceae bacterium]
MTRGGAAPKIPPVGWVFVNPRLFSDNRYPEGVTIRWRRGDAVVYVLHGQRVGDHATEEGVLATIPAPSAGWTDLTDIRSLGTRWLRRQ